MYVNNDESLLKIEKSCMSILLNLVVLETIILSRLIYSVASRNIHVHISILNQYDVPATL